MFYYAEKFLNPLNENEISPKIQIIDLVSLMRAVNDENTKQIAQFYIELKMIYYMIKPRRIHKMW